MSSEPPDPKRRAWSSVESPAELVQSALDAVRQWKYTPTLLNGQPVNVSIVIQVGYGAR